MNIKEEIEKLLKNNELIDKNIFRDFVFKVFENLKDLLGDTYFLAVSKPYSGLLDLKNINIYNNKSCKHPK